eukprot:jgi/Ulvmu1/1755/UM117_0032.1
MNPSLQICRLNARNSVPRRNGRASKPSPSSFVLQSRPTVVTTLRCDNIKVAAGHGDLGFDETDYVSAAVESVKTAPAVSNGPVIGLKLESRGTILSVYVGDAEAASLRMGLQNKPVARPLTHDLTKNLVEVLGYQVVAVRIHSLVNNTYHARVHMCKAGGGGTPIDVDARPSDAINLAVRFSARILVAKDIAERMSVPIADPLSAASAAGGAAGGGGARPSGAGGRRLTESDAEIVKSCKAECAMYTDPTIIYNLKLQLAVEQEQYTEAAAIRDKMNQVIACDQSLRLVVAIEKAIDDSRFDEAARLRDELSQLRKSATRTPQQHHQHPPQ